ncbi:unnamed protein product, partial [Timema podura]|nr:unnamed protein product [Timema podura]
WSSYSSVSLSSDTTSQSPLGSQVMLDSRRGSLCPFPVLRELGRRIIEYVCWRATVVPGYRGSYPCRTTYSTSTAVASILYQLSLHPDKQQLLYEEIRSVLPLADTSITTQHLEKLVYLKACIRETLRMFPVVIGNGRCMMRDTVIAGYQIPAGVSHIGTSIGLQFTPD